MSQANRFKNLYREQIWIFCLRFFLKSSLLEMLIAFGNEHLKNYEFYCTEHVPSQRVREKITFIKRLVKRGQKFWGKHWMRKFPFSQNWDAKMSRQRREQIIEEEWKSKEMKENWHLLRETRKEKNRHPLSAVVKTLNEKAKDRWM